jgi:hypothetical protein
VRGPGRIPKGPPETRRILDSNHIRRLLSVPDTSQPIFHFSNQPNQTKQTCLDAEKVERFVDFNMPSSSSHVTYNNNDNRDSEREEPSVTGRFFVTTSRVSPSLPFVVLLAVEVSSVSRVSFTRRLVAFSKLSWKMCATISSFLFRF